MRNIDAYSNRELLAGIGKTVRNARTGKGMLQSELAENSGLSQFSVSQIENGRNTSMLSLISIFRALDRLDFLETVAGLGQETKAAVDGYAVRREDAILCEPVSSVSIDWTEFDNIAREENTTRGLLLKKIVDLFVEVRRESKPSGILKYKGIASSITDEEIDSDLRLRRMFAR